jgi:NADH dehydrogenase
MSLNVRSRPQADVALTAAEGHVTRPLADRSPSGQPHVLIVGSGFGGLNCARTLKGSPVRVTLVDRVNFHLFQPLLYEVATAALSVNEIAAATRMLFRAQRNVAVHMLTIEAIDIAGRCVRASDGHTIAYDWLVLAPGAVTDYFGHPEWAAHAPGLKTVEDALATRRRVLLGFERAESEVDHERRRSYLTFVIVGGGATGVELAGAIGEMKNYTLRHEFRAIDSADARILLLDAGERILPNFAPALSARACRDLERLGVEVRTRTLVTEVGPDYVVAGDERIATCCVLWGAGTRGAPVLASLGVPLDRQGRVQVGVDGAVPDHVEIFVVGDGAHFDDAGSGTPLPGVAQVAIQMGRHAARCIADDLAGRPRRAFKYSDRGKLAVIGRGRAICEIGPLKLSGLPAWFVWAFVHVTFLIGFRNRVVAMTEWARTYFFQHRSGRFIIGDR